MKKIITGFITLFLISNCLHPQAAGFSNSFDSKQSKLKNKTIIEIGEAKKVQQPNDSQWNKELFTINGKCFVFNETTNYRNYNEANFILADTQNNMYLATLVSYLSSIKVDIEPVSLVDCPNGANIIPNLNTSDDPNEQLKFNEEYKKNLDQYHIKIMNEQKIIIQKNNELLKKIKKMREY